jgi:pimeloyl-ACP methyl ester carboxylesterase
MDEQQPLLNTPPDNERRFWERFRRIRVSATWVTALILVGGFISLLVAQTRREVQRPDAYTIYPGESIKWQRCGELAGRVLECSSIDVPIDQFNTSNSGSKTFNVPLIRLRGHNATRNLLLNPGGPGSSGLRFIYVKGQNLNEIVGDGFHLVSFDPRGANKSTPLASCYQTDEARRDLSPVRDRKFPEDAANLYAWSKNFAQGCVDTMGEHGLYVNTPQTAADMNSILDALGQEKMVYWGFSYGSLLGQTYATLFPDRVERLIIDGVSNQFDWYENKLDSESLVDTENVFLGFIDECIKAGQDCSLTSLADSKQGLFDIFQDFSANLLEQPLSIYINSTTYGVIDHRSFWYDVVFPALYSPSQWSILADRLTQLFTGNGTAAFLAYSHGGFVRLAGDILKYLSYNDGVSGPGYWDQNLSTIVDLLGPFFNSSLFGEAYYGFYFPKQQWRVPRTHTYIPRYDVKTSHPLLILSTTYDPVCPLVSAKTANAMFLGSRIVEVKGYGHCSIAVTSLCVAKRVREYLHDGKLPDTNIQCEVDDDWSYFGKEELGKPSQQSKRYEDPTEERIHLAQRDLARTSWLDVF